MVICSVFTFYPCYSCGKLFGVTADFFAKIKVDAVYGYDKM